MKKNLKEILKWNALFESGVKYRELNEAFVLVLVDKYKAMTGGKLKHVVDLGCGNGATLARFCVLGIEVTGIDFSSVALKKAQKTLMSCRGGATLIEANLNNLANLRFKTPNNTLWLCKLVLAFIKDKAKFLKKVRGLMKDNDLFFIMTPVLHQELSYQKEDKPGIAIRAEEVDNFLRSTFREVQIFAEEYPGERGHIISYLVKK